MKLRAIVTVEYEPDPAHYGTDDVAVMAAIDQKNWQGHPIGFFSSFDDDEYTVRVEPA